MTARGGRGSPGSTSPSRGKPGGPGWASLGKRTKKGTGRDCSGPPRRPGRLQGPVSRAQQHPPAVTQGRRRKPGRHGRPGAWEARAHHPSPRIVPTPRPPAGRPASGDTLLGDRDTRPGTYGTGRARAPGEREAWGGCVDGGAAGWALRGSGGCGFGGCTDGGLRAGGGFPSGESPRWGKKTALQPGVAKKRWERSGGGKERPGSCPARPGEDEPGGTYLLLLGAELRGHAARRAGPSRAEPGCSRRRAPWRSPSPPLRAPAPPGGEGGSAPGAPPKVPRKLK